MAAMDKAIKKGFIRYVNKHYPAEANDIIKRADDLFPKLYSKAPDIGGKENIMSYNLDLLIMTASFYEASDHRIDGDSVTEIADDIFGRLRFLRHIVNVNHKWQMKLIRYLMYKRYVPYAKLVEEKKSQGLWGNTWGVKVDENDPDEGVKFELVGCPLADYAKANGYMNLLPYMCASDHLMPPMVHAKLIRTHTCALGSETCDYWYVADESDAAKNFRGTIV